MYNIDEISKNFTINGLSEPPSIIMHSEDRYDIEHEKFTITCVSTNDEKETTDSLYKLVNILAIAPGLIKELIERNEKLKKEVYALLRSIELISSVKADVQNLILFDEGGDDMEFNMSDFEET